MRQHPIPLWVKILYTLFVSVLIPVYWVEYGPANFLWGSDIALIVTVITLWTGSRLLASMMALAVLITELGWNIDFICRLVVGPEAICLHGTEYMFDEKVPLFVRGLSMFHTVLPVLLIWLVYRLGYHPRALYYQTLLTWVILPATYVLTDPSANINWVHGFGHEPQTWIPGPLYVGVLMVLIPLVLYLPTHLLLSRLFDVSSPRHKSP